jgi:aminoglycoside phosphotransferase (APT) family kinase protein
VGGEEATLGRTPEVSAAADTIDVREDERFDERRLQAWLLGRLEGTDRPLRVRQFGGGAANLTYLLDFDGVEYVLRRPPLGPVAPSSHDMAREFRVLSVLHRAFPEAPRALLFGDDPSVIGAPFFVMERRRGIVVRRRWPPELSAQDDAPRRITEALVDALARLHAVDYAALGLGDLGRPEGFLGRQVEGWHGRFQKAQVDDVPAMGEVHRWLATHLPPAGPAALLHNDYKLDNVLLDAADPGRVSAVFDWDMATLGDPLADLGALLAYWTEPGDPPAFRAMALMPTTPGFPGRDLVAERYARASGRDLGDLAFYHVLGLFRLAVIAAQIYVRFHRGQTRDARFAAFRALVPAVAEAARERLARTS